MTSRPQQETDLWIGHTSFGRSLIIFLLFASSCWCQDWERTAGRLLQFQPEDKPCRTWTKLCCSCAKKEMKCRRESGNWIRRWPLWAFSMDYEPRPEVFRPPVENGQPCQPQHARESPQRNGHVGRSGKQLGGENKDKGAFARLFSHLFTLCVDAIDLPRKNDTSGTISGLTRTQHGLRAGTSRPHNLFPSFGRKTARPNDHSIRFAGA